MFTFVNHISARIMGLALAVTAAMPVVLHAQTISNVATLQWDIGTNRVSRASNRIDIQVERAITAAPTLQTFQLSNAANAQHFAVPATQCHGTGGVTPITLSGAFAGTSLSPASLTPSTQIRAGEPLVIAMTSPADNQNPNAIETIMVKVETPNGILKHSSCLKVISTLVYLSV